MHQTSDIAALETRLAKLETAFASLNQSVPDDEFLTVADVAQMLRLSYLTVSRYIASGRLTAYRVGRSVRIRRADYDSFAKSKQRIDKVQIEQEALRRVVNS